VFFAQQYSEDLFARMLDQRLVLGDLFEIGVVGTEEAEEDVETML